MPPRLHSRYTFSKGFEDTDEPGVRLLTDRIPFEYRDLEDNVHHIVGEGDTLHSLAAQFFEPLPRPAGLWWVIADFQPEPIHDPTIKLTVGTTIIIPSVRTIEEVVFNEKRRLEEV